MDNQLQIENQFECGILKFDDRVKNSRYTFWSHIFKKKHAELKAARKAKEKEIYGELMQMETLAKECEPSESSIKLISKIQKLKGVVGLVCLCFLSVNAIFVFNNALRTRRSGGGQSRVVRIVKKGRECYG